MLFVNIMKYQEQSGESQIKEDEILTKEIWDFSLKEWDLKFESVESTLRSLLDVTVRSGIWGGSSRI